MDDTARALRFVLLYAWLPVWILAGFLDWLCHRVQRIENSAGTMESSIHLLMLAELGAGLAAALLLRVDAAVLAIVLAACFAHELTAWWDLAYASSRRRIPPYEQWVHGLQIVLPWAGAAGLAILHWPQAFALVGAGDERAEWSLGWKSPPLPIAYLGAVGAAAALLVAAPFVEELRRCVRARRRDARA